MWSVWNRDECMSLFGEWLGGHIWAKWTDRVHGCGSIGAPSAIYADLDSECRRKLAERAMAHYNK